MPEVCIGQLRLYYEAEGDGPGVILLHELGGSTETWSDLQPRLVRAGLRVVALDLRGAGRSDVPAAGYALPDLADDVLRVAQRRWSDFRKRPVLDGSAGRFVEPGQGETMRAGEFQYALRCNERRNRANLGE